MRTLAVKELFSYHTSRNLKIVVNEILSKYNIFCDRICTFTSANGRNMVKLGELLRENEVKEIEETIDDTHREEADNIVNFSATTLVRCCAHTLQLAVLDTINDSSVNRIIVKVCKYILIFSSISTTLFFSKIPISSKILF